MPTPPDKKFPSLLDAKLKKLVHMRDGPTDAPPGEGYAPPSEDTVKFLRRLQYFLSLKIHRTPLSDEPRMGIPQVNDDGLVARLSVSPDFKQEMKDFFREHNQDPAQKHNPLVYHTLYKYASDYLEQHNEPELTLWKRAISLTEKKGGTPATPNERGAVTGRTPSEVVQQLDVDKPLVIYCGGVLDFSEKRGFMDRALERIERLLYAADLPAGDYNLFGVTYQNTSALKKTSVIHGYNADPKKFYSEHAQEFVSRLMMPLLVEEKGGQVERADLQTIKRRMSNITFFAYSYGSIFVHEVENALSAAMTAETATYKKNGTTQQVKMGFTRDEARDILSSLRAVSVGNTANLVDKDECGVIPSIATTAKDDMVSQARSDNEALLAHDPVKALRHARVGSNLLLEAESVGDTAPAMRFIDTAKGRSISQIIEEEVARVGPDAPIFVKEGGKSKSTLTATAFPIATLETSHAVAQGHHPVAYMRSSRVREDGEHTFQTHPGAEAVKAFFRQSLNESRRANEKGEVRSNGTALLDRIESGYLSPDAIAAVVRDMKISRRVFDAFGKDQIDSSYLR